ncbi:MAG: hypothetical protein HOQ05_13805 [Corynebacteriales bacterium]|nr:hypothetical protein [Mycobacteriales bacterium]
MSTPTGPVPADPGAARDIEASLAVVDAWTHTHAEELDELRQSLTISGFAAIVIARMVQAGELDVGDHISFSDYLADILQVPKQSVSHALHILRNRGIITPVDTHQGSRIVAYPKASVMRSLGAQAKREGKSADSLNAINAWLDENAETLARERPKLTGVGLAKVVLAQIIHERILQKGDRVPFAADLAITLDIPLTHARRALRALRDDRQLLTGAGNRGGIHVDRGLGKSALKELIKQERQAWSRGTSLEAIEAWLENNAEEATRLKAERPEPGYAAAVVGKVLLTGQIKVGTFLPDSRHLSQALGIALDQSRLGMQFLEREHQLLFRGPGRTTGTKLIKMPDEATVQEILDATKSAERLGRVYPEVENPVGQNTLRTKAKRLRTKLARQRNTSPEEIQIAIARSWTTRQNENPSTESNDASMLRHTAEVLRQLPPGGRLPSQKWFEESHHGTVTGVTHALGILRDLGLIYLARGFQGSTILAAPTDEQLRIINEFADNFPEESRITVPPRKKRQGSERREEIAQDLEALLWDSQPGSVLHEAARLAEAIAQTAEPGDPFPAQNRLRGVLRIGGSRVNRIVDVLETAGWIKIDKNYTTVADFENGPSPDQIRNGTFLHDQPTGSWMTKLPGPGKPAGDHGTEATGYTYWAESVLRAHIDTGHWPAGIHLPHVEDIAHKVNIKPSQAHAILTRLAEDPEGPRIRLAKPDVWVVHEDVELRDPPGLIPLAREINRKISDGQLEISEGISPERLKKVVGQTITDGESVYALRQLAHLKLVTATGRGRFYDRAPARVQAARREIQERQRFNEQYGLTEQDIATAIADQLSNGPQRSPGVSVAQHLAAAIAEYAVAELEQNVYLPSQKALRSTTGMSENAVIGAYAILREQGYARKESEDRTARSYIHIERAKSTPNEMRVPAAHAPDILEQRDDHAITLPTSSLQALNLATLQTASAEQDAQHLAAAIGLINTAIDGLGSQWESAGKHRQIAAALAIIANQHRAQHTAEGIAPGTRPFLGTTLALAEGLGVTPKTLREALTLTASEGITTTQKGIQHDGNKRFHGVVISPDAPDVNPRRVLPTR